MLSTVEQEARYLGASETMADARQRFADIVGRVSELIVERQAPSGSAKQAVHAQLVEDVKVFVTGKDRP